MPFSAGFLIRVVLAVVLMALLFYFFIPVDAFLEQLLNMNLALFGVLLVLQFGRRLLAALQLYLLGWRREKPLGYGRIFYAQNIGSAASFVSPGDSGVTLVTYYVLSRDLNSNSQALSYLLYLRLLRYMVMLLFAFIGFVFEPRLMDYGLQYLLLVFTLLLGVGVLLFHNGRVYAFARSLSASTVRRYRSRKLRMVHRKIWNALRFAASMPSGDVAATLAAVLGAQCLAVLCFYSAQFALGIELPWSVALWCMPVIVIMTAVPIAFSGLGIREITVSAMLFQFYALDVASSTALSLVIFVSYALVGILLSCVLFAFRR